MMKIERKSEGAVKHGERMTQETALEMVDRMAAIRRAELVDMARECGMPETKTFLLLAQEPCLPPVTTTLKKFVQPIDPAAIRTVERDLEAIDPQLMKEIVDTMIQRLGVSSSLLGVKSPKDHGEPLGGNGDV